MFTLKSNTISNDVYQFRNSELNVTFCSQEDASPVQSRHKESNTKTYVWLLNVMLSLDTDNHHQMLGHVIHASSMENGI